MKLVYLFCLLESVQSKELRIVFLKVENSVWGFNLSLSLCSFLQYISSEVNPPSDETDSSSAPSKEQLEQEKQLLLSFKPVMQKFLHDHVDLQVSALYALQVHCYNSNFPKGERTNIRKLASGVILKQHTK